MATVTREKADAVVGSIMDVYRRETGNTACESGKGAVKQAVYKALGISQVVKGQKVDRVEFVTRIVTTKGHIIEVNDGEPTYVEIDGDWSVARTPSAIQAGLAKTWNEYVQPEIDRYMTAKGSIK